ncbi:BES1/BZR1 homolog protein 3-like [Camellia sinensis]|uniref:BES1/BZR1 homolog protein 3-like n=1 Tax=Camellia sinensis TaxID=4442 RepID=UPI00103662C2|nr:BES1/BZR1 homolog protein 3-like [Camellia sinensis]
MVDGISGTIEGVNRWHLELGKESLIPDRGGKRRVNGGGSLMLDGYGMVVAYLDEAASLTGEGTYRQDSTIKAAGQRVEMFLEAHVVGIDGDGGLVLGKGELLDVVEGYKPIEHMEIMGGSASASPCSSYQPSPCASYNPSPTPSSFPSPISSPYAANAISNGDANSLIPWLKNLSSGGSSKLPHHLYIHGSSISAPVTPPLSSPTAGYQTPPDSGWLSSVQTPQDGPSSLTFSLVASSPFVFKKAFLGGGSRMWTSGQSGTCSPAFAAGCDQTSDVPMFDGTAAKSVFSSNTKGLVKACEGERIHEECLGDDLELTLGNCTTR